MSRPRVVVYENDTDAVPVIAAALEVAGFDALHVPVARVGGEGELSPRPDFALLETSGSERDDMAIAGRLARANVPFVVLSARGHGGFERAVAAGAMGCFVKPLDVRII